MARFRRCFVECEDLELFRFRGENADGGQVGVDLFVFGVELAAVFVQAESEEIVLDSTDTPTIGASRRQTPRG